MKEIVSVIMPCYNDGKYLEASIRSVREQTYSNWELILIDDGSDEPDTLRIIQELEAEEYIRVFRTRHIGVAAARNYGIQRATGTFILPLDADDMIDPTYIEKAIGIMEQDEEIGIVYCYADLFGEASGLWSLPRYSFEEMLRDNIIFISALFYKKDWKAVGGFNTNMVHGMEDYDFWIGLLELGRKVYQIPEVLFHYRIKKKSRTVSLLGDIENTKKMYRQIYENHHEFYNKYKDDYALQLREALIEQIYFRNSLIKANSLYNAIRSKCPLIFAVMKKIMKKGGKNK